uniref:Uncharacterized protein n=1 Tax=Salix viminalis TaxID=40686 RepID=A0A6N2MSH0_SALVM
MPNHEFGGVPSCAPSIISNRVVIKVLFCDDGNLQIYTKPVKAAESESRSKNSWLVADDELERRQLYFVLPMELLYSVLTREEMSSLTYKATRALKYNNFVKIFPVLMEKQWTVWPQNSSLWRGIPSKDHGSPPWKPLLKLLAVGGLDDDQRLEKSHRSPVPVGTRFKRCFCCLVKNRKLDPIEIIPGGAMKIVRESPTSAIWEGSGFDEEMEVAKSEISKEGDDGFELLRVNEPIKMMYVAALCDDLLF